MFTSYPMDVPDSVSQVVGDVMYVESQKEYRPVFTWPLPPDALHGTRGIMAVLYNSGLVNVPAYLRPTCESLSRREKTITQAVCDIVGYRAGDIGMWALRKGFYLEGNIWDGPVVLRRCRNLDQIVESIGNLY